MYNKLIKRLRENHSEEFGDKWDFAFACQQAMHEAADTIEELSKPKWIPCSERLPKEWKIVLTFQPTTTDDKGIIQTCVYIGIPGKWRQAWNHEFLELPVTHWMPLPELPKEE